MQNELCVVSAAENNYANGAKHTVGAHTIMDPYIKPRVCMCDALAMRIRIMKREKDKVAG